MRVWLWICLWTETPSGLVASTLRVTILPIAEESFDADWNLVNPGYFNTMGIALIQGRDFRESDREGVPETAIINETMARQFWLGEDPVGRRFFNGPVGPGADGIEVIGVARDVKNEYLTDASRPMIYESLSQRYTPGQSLVVRTTEPVSVIPAVRKVFAELSPDLPIITVNSMQDVASFAMLPERMAAWVAGTMGWAGLLLAVDGSLWRHLIRRRLPDARDRNPHGARGNASSGN